MLPLLLFLDADTASSQTSHLPPKMDNETKTGEGEAPPAEISTIDHSNPSSSTSLSFMDDGSDANESLIYNARIGNDAAIGELLSLVVSGGPPLNVNHLGMVCIISVCGWCTFSLL